MRAVTTLVLGAVLCASPLARAQDQGLDVPAPPTAPPAFPLEEDAASPRAREHFLAGVSYLHAGAYADALREWRRAYALSGRAELLFHLSLAHEALGQLREAHDSLRRFLEEADTIDDRASHELRLASLERRTRPREPAPGEATPTAFYVSPGAIVGFVAAGVGLVTFAVAGALAIAEDLRLREACATRCFGRVGDDLRTFALISDLGLGLTIVGAALAGVFLFADRGLHRVAVVAPVLAADGGGLIVRGRM